MTYIWHVNINTGRAEKLPIAAASAEDMAQAHQLLAGTGRQPVLGTTLTVDIVHDGPNLVATFFGGAVPVVTMGVATKSRAAARLWEMLIEAAGRAGAAPASGAGDVPRAPWAGIIVYGSFLGHMDEMPLLGRLEHALACAYLDR